MMDFELQFVKAVNEWCRDHGAMVVNVTAFARGIDYSARVILSNGDDVSACDRTASTALAYLDDINAKSNGPRNDAEVHAAVLRGLVVME